MDTIQQLFQSDYARYRQQYRPGLHQIKAARNIQKCRTGFFGVRLEQCPHHHESTFRFNACHHRSCPQCNALPRQQWLDKTLTRLLPVPHRQVVFTIAHELLPLYRLNTALMINRLFECSAWTLKRFLQDPKRLNAEAGFILAYHSWGRNLSLHPHIHALITEGGRSVSGDWVSPKTKTQLPAKAMMQCFRGRFISRLRVLFRQGDLTLPSDKEGRVFYTLLESAYKKPWNVKVEPPYPHGRGLIQYLGRYLRGGPVRTGQVRVHGHTVRFSYKDHRSGSRKRMEMESSHFIARLLRHVPPANLPMIRHYGLYGNRRRQQLTELRTRISVSINPRAQLEHRVDCCPPIWLLLKGSCRTCGEKLMVRVFRV